MSLAFRLQTSYVSGKLGPDGRKLRDGEASESGGVSKRSVFRDYEVYHHSGSTGMLETTAEVPSAQEGDRRVYLQRNVIDRYHPDNADISVQYFGNGKVCPVVVSQSNLDIHIYLRNKSADLKAVGPFCRTLHWLQH